MLLYAKKALSWICWCGLPCLESWKLSPSIVYCNRVSRRFWTCLIWYVLSIRLAIVAYVLLSNHYHVCLKTEDANLVVGMQWLQSTFANRFNRFVHECDHVFQGRYQALLVEDSASVLRVVNYIHLNPVRAGLQTIDTLKEHLHSSFPMYFKKRRPWCLTLSLHPGRSSWQVG